MKKIIVLRGNSGSGKTTVAKELQQRFGRNTMLISQDVVRRDMLYARDGENTETLPLLKELVKYGYSHNEIVILEGILYNKWYFSLFELIKELYENNIYAWYFDLLFEETLKRHRKKPNCQEFGEKEMRRWWIEKDYSDELNEQTITQEKSFESIVSEIYSIVTEK